MKLLELLRAYEQDRKTLEDVQQEITRQQGYARDLLKRLGAMTVTLGAYLERNIQATAGALGPLGLLASLGDETKEPMPGDPPGFDPDPPIGSPGEPAELPPEL